ncbi:MAG TPA: holo-ACP synthase [Syntrophales bacterium]|nr:holo-ACP synthase [Syntrophales bacterium]HPQ44411.1 holo-ACP synthase [Syntrophales bacterium]
MIYAIGTDLVEISRIEGIIDKRGKRFVERVYSKGEIRYCNERAFPAQHFAARFAAKEAFFKCMGRGIFDGVGLRDVEVINGPDGKPELKFYGKARTMVDKAGITGNHISISHTDKYAMAFVVLECDKTH